MKLLYYCTSKVGHHNRINLGTSVLPAFDRRTAYSTECKKESCVVARLFCSWWCGDKTQHPPGNRTMTLTRHLTKLLGKGILMFSENGAD